MIETEVTTRRLIVGCGYLGLRVGRLWAADGGPVYALTRKHERFDEFREEGWSPLLGDLCGSLPDWPEVDTALLAVGFDRAAGNAIEDVYVGGVERLIETLPNSIRKLIYISSTGVYGAGGGETVNERSECQPDRPGGAACLAAENKLRASRFGDRTIILRLAGIYGPQRVPRLGALAQGEPIAANGEGFLNLIHVDDAARIVTAMEAAVEPPELFCVSDNAPCRRKDFLGAAAKLMGYPAPTFDDSSPSSRRGGDKRVDSSKLLSRVDVSLTYPTFELGLRNAIAAGELS